MLDDQLGTPIRRILVYGVTGSGKTTLAASISEKTGLPWHSVDDLTFEPGWVQVPADIQRSRIEGICSGSHWILDSAYGAWLDVPIVYVDLVVALDYPRWVSLSRLLRRTFCRLFDGKTICNGNRESLWTLFSGESIILWHFRSFAWKRARIRKWDSDPNGPRVLRIQTPKQLESWLDQLAFAQ